MIGLRILPDAPGTAFFANHGMPLSAALTARRGKFAFEDGYAFYNDPALASFRGWLDESGRATYYVAYLATHPLVSVGRPLSRHY